MELHEKELLRTAILTINDPRGNWDYGWHMICQLAELDPLNFSAPFRNRSIGELMDLNESEQELRAVRTRLASESPPRNTDSKTRNPNDSGQTQRGA